ncbi:hypothetical protein J7E45_02605 [Microbacterium sp. ISL-59]|uniref:DUF6325 family protein n=1 Tax=Microbacterium sp. ISL-59 TaxID=2819159 RepID=UPI001BE5B307|nr:DUF6325 family protein [Microbacterium sp. ISL-59]MBT2494485.1 hypothetical protein [Microbacterium sp. ISL-59]
MAEVVDMTLEALGDVEFVVVRLEDDRLSPDILEALLRQVESGAIRLLDFLLIRRLDVEDWRLIEIDADEFTLAGLGLDTPGLVCEEDARHFASGLPIGSLAALILVEPTWSERFSRDVDRRGDRILATQPIPAAIANTVLASALRQD